MTAYRRSAGQLRPSALYCPPGEGIVARLEIFAAFAKAAFRGPLPLPVEHDVQGAKKAAATAYGS
jgi:sugar phosphate isomerase/epimerase